MRSKGRWQLVLGENDARAIRSSLADGVARSTLATRFGVHITLIDKIAEGRRWREVA
jgi:hypothetical protein